MRKIQICFFKGMDAWKHDECFWGNLKSNECTKNFLMCLNKQVNIFKYFKIFLNIFAIFKILNFLLSLNFDFLEIFVAATW